jgi:hypothetical protein
MAERSGSDPPPGGRSSLTAGQTHIRWILRQDYWHPVPHGDYGQRNAIARHKVTSGRIRTHWPDMLRVAASLATGTVRAYDLLRMLGRDGNPSPPGHAFADYGRIAKTLHLLAMCDPDETYRRTVHTQLAVQESRRRLARKNRGGGPMGEIVSISGAYPAPAFSHAADVPHRAHRPGCLVTGDRGEVPADLTILTARLAELAPATAANVAELGTDAGARALTEAFTAAFGALAPATRARHLSALRSALAWWRGAGWLAGYPAASWARPKISVDVTRALTRDQVAALWRLDVPLRDKTLWRLLYETAARAGEILGLDAGDLELPGKRARVISKGGMTEWVHWQTGAALLLPRLLADRRRGPVFEGDVAAER